MEKHKDKQYIKHWTNSKFTWRGQDCWKLVKNATETRNKIVEKKNYNMEMIQAAAIAELRDLSSWF